MQLPLHKKMSNQEISEVFKFISGVLALQGANLFRYRAYDNAASVIAELTEPLHHMFLHNPDFAKLPGIGDTLEKKLVELFTTGNVVALQEYVKDIPAATFPLSQVHGIGVKRSYAICHHFHLDNPDTALQDVLTLALAGKIRLLDGFGEKSEQDLITRLSSHSVKSRMAYKDALRMAEKIISQLNECPAITTSEALGSLRRQNPTVGDIDIGIVTTDMGLVKDFVKKMKSVKTISVAGENVIRIFLTSGEQVDIKASTPKEWGAFLQHYTGSKEHNIMLREFALKQGYSLSEHGIKEVANPTVIHHFDKEEKFYEFLGLNWIKPQNRRGGEEIEQARKR